MERSNHISGILEVLPSQPGVYRFLDSSGKIIYVGKAINLRKRVTSYFTKNHPDLKTRMMVRRIVDLKIIVVEKESDALLLENNMIKQHQPRYNILLKDDKTFPWVCIKNEDFPRVYITRKVVKDGSRYFGPYTSIYIVRTVLELVKKLFPLRNCARFLNPKLIQNGRYSQSCLEYHLGNCLAPCIGLQTSDHYESNILRIIQILNGNLNEIRDYLSVEMLRNSTELNFEKAQLLKEKVALIDKFQAKSIIVNPVLDNIEVFSLINETEIAYVNYLRVQKGAIIQSHNLTVKKGIDEPAEDFMALVILDIRQRLDSNVPEVILAFRPSVLPPGLKVIVPKKGEKLKLLELSERNARAFKTEVIARELNSTFSKGKDRLLQKVKMDLRLTNVPEIIECFDNSNLQGSNPVAACVVFRNGRPARSEYRMFNIRSVYGPNDFASMEEVVFRRYKRMMDEEKALPQLIIIDGGKGQLSSAVASLEKLNLTGKLAIIGIAKKLEEIYFPGDSVPLYLDKTSETLKTIQRIRDEAHRFGITFHRNKRSGKFLNTELTGIRGIGEGIASKLLKKYKSVKKLREIPFEELTKSIGKSRAMLIMNYFKQDSIAGISNNEKQESAG